MKSLILTITFAFTALVILGAFPLAHSMRQSAGSECIGQVAKSLSCPTANPEGSLFHVQVFKSFSNFTVADFFIIIGLLILLSFAFWVIIQPKVNFLKKLLNLYSPFLRRQRFWRWLTILEISPNFS